ncbi:MAG: ParB/RepB/Spo0J family partition protein [Clostridia bacterium]|nr:ParB/RepB/Spo0J family partition protein [Clostridia bacterium]
MRIYYQKPLAQEEEGEQVHSIEVSKISPNPNQPRRIFTDDAIIKLADSIRQYGMIQPITVRKIGDGYEIISGERRLRAAKELRMDRVPCIIMNINEEKSAEISIIENLIREDLNIFEQAQAIETLIDTYNLTQEEIARRLSNSQSFVANKLRLLRLTPSERELILKNNLTERHARALLKVFDHTMREKLLNTIIEQGLNVSKSELLIDSTVDSGMQSKETRQKNHYKSIKSFYIAVDRAVNNVKGSGINIKTRRIESDDFVELTILIPKSSDKSIDNNYSLLINQKNDGSVNKDETTA